MEMSWVDFAELAADSRDYAGHDGHVRAGDVRLGESYAAIVPQRWHSQSADWTENVPILARGRWFPVIVTAVDRAASPAIAEALRVVQRSRAIVWLTADQSAQLGLPAGGSYRLDGALLDVNGDGVYLPEVWTVRLPTRWLRDLSNVTAERDIYGRPLDW